MLTPECRITVKPGDPPTVVVAGEVNYESAPRIREAFDRLAERGQVRLCLDCGSVDFIDSSGIGAIVNAAQRLKRAGGTLRLRAARPQLIHALQVSGFARLVLLDPGVQQRSPTEQPSSAVPGIWQQSGFSIPVTADKDGFVRKRVTQLAETMEFTADQIDDIRLAVGEAVANAIRHGCGSGDARITVCCTGDAEKLVVEISNPGAPFDPDALPAPDPESPREGGMGIFFMRAAMDKVRYEFGENGTTVTMVKFLGEDHSGGNRPGGLGG